MYSFAVNLLPLFAWILRTTCQASLLIVVILAIQRVFDRRLGVRGRYWLWLLVLARLALPWEIPSRASIYNLLPLPQAASEVLGTGDHASEHSPAGPGGLWPGSDESRLDAWIPIFLALVWLAGVCGLAGCIGVHHIRLRRLVRRGRPVWERWVLDLLEDCKGLIGTRVPVRVLATDGTGSPALFGLFRPWLVLPCETLARREPAELRHIFLHELAHLKRRDILVGHVASVLHVLHWFNPLIALGLRRMRADRELACDGLVLSVLKAEEAPAYGRTILLEIERFAASRPRWMAAGLSGDGTRIKQRIAMIGLPHRHIYQWSLLALVLFNLLAFAGLTDAIVVRDPPVYLPAQAGPTTHEDRHGNIIRIHLRNRETGKYLVVHGEEAVCDAIEPGMAGLWEARFDDDFGGRREIVYFYSVAARKYLTWDATGKVAVNGLEPNEAARWNNWAQSDGARITPHERWGSYVEPDPQGRIGARGDPALWVTWDVEQLWRVKTSDNPKCNSEWRRQYVPGPDWYGARPGWSAPK